MNMTVQPEQLKMFNPETLQIRWSDGEVRQYTVPPRQLPLRHLQGKKESSAAASHFTVCDQSRRSSAATHHQNGTEGSLRLHHLLQRWPRHRALHARSTARARDDRVESRPEQER